MYAAAQQRGAPEYVDPLCKRGPKRRRKRQRPRPEMRSYANDESTWAADSAVSSSVPMGSLPPSHFRVHTTERPTSPLSDDGPPPAIGSLSVFPSIGRPPPVHRPAALQPEAAAAAAARRGKDGRQRSKGKGQQRRGSHRNSTLEQQWAVEGIDSKFGAADLTLKAAIQKSASLPALGPGPGLDGGAARRGDARRAARAKKAGQLKRRMAGAGKVNSNVVRAFESPLIAAHGGKRAVEDWVAAYGSDKPHFASSAKWGAVTLSEARQLHDAGGLPAHAVIGAVAQMLASAEEGLGRAVFKNGAGMRGEQALTTAVTLLMRSVFCIGGDVVGGMSIGDPVWRRQAVGEASGHSNPPRALLLHFLRCPTFHGRALALEQKLRAELKLRPTLEARIVARQREREMEARALEAAANRWSSGLLRWVLERWRTSSGDDRRKRVLGKYFMHLTSLKPRHIFELWSNLTKKEKWMRDRRKWANAKERADTLRVELDVVNRHNKELKLAREKAAATNATLRGKLDAAIAKLNEPARQPEALLGVLTGVQVAASAAFRLHGQQMEAAAADECRATPDCTRLRPLYATLRGIGSDAQAFTDARKCVGGEEDAESDCEDAVEAQIAAWRPGLLKSKEDTPCFKPFDNRFGRRLRRFANLRSCTGHAAELKIGKVRPALFSASNPHPKNGLGFAMVAYDIMCSPNDENNKGEAQKLKALLSPMALKLTHPIARCNAIVRALKELSHPVGRYMEQEHLSGMKHPPTDEENDRKRIVAERLQKRQQETGIIVHTMSQYMGQRIHVEATNFQRQFAAQAELFCSYYRRDRQPHFVEAAAAAAKSKIGAAARAAAAYVGGLEKAVKLTPLEHTHAELLEVAGALAAASGALKGPSLERAEFYTACVADRDEFVAHVHGLHGVAWQSMCTTILARKVRTEEDIDDGTFTTVKKVQIASEFKRIGCKEEDYDSQCAQMKEFLKMRIRDLKRIFQFYSASGDGAATSMDHSEFWRFVKDCRLQKDRKQLPSARVDIIFQYCNMDFEKEGKDRLDADDGELDPTEWVEALVRVAAYKYEKGTLAQRLELMMNEDILPNACAVNTDVFRERLAGEAVNACYKRSKRYLKVVYQAYCAADDSDAGAGNVDTMSIGELVISARELKIIGNMFSEKALRTLFAYVQREEELEVGGDDDDGFNGESGDSEMVYGEFQEAIGGIASQLKPDPYNVLEMRLEGYLNTMYFPAAVDHIRFKKNGRLNWRPPKKEGIEE